MQQWPEKTVMPPKLSTQSAVYECLVPYEDTSTETTVLQLLLLDYNRSVFRGTAVEYRSLAGELSLSCARPVADGWLMLVNRSLWVNQPGQLNLSFLRGW